MLESHMKIAQRVPFLGTFRTPGRAPRAGFLLINAFPLHFCPGKILLVIYHFPTYRNLR